jgi:cytochrome c oxidase subunit 2
MLAEIIWFPKSGSTTAQHVDGLLIGLASITGAVGLLVAVLLIGFAVRYRRRPGLPPPLAMPGNRPLEIFWTITPFLIFIGLFAWGANVYFAAYRAPDDATVIYGIGKQWMWKFQHPEGQREINELHVPVGKSVKIILTSEDVIHSFFIPEFRVHMDALPARYTSVWFEATRPDTYKLFCSQFCGTGHATMVGQVIAMKPTDYQQWLRAHAEGSLALEGRKTFLKYRCISCHSADEKARAPVLEELYGKVVALQDGRSVIADEAYIRESILHPGAKIVAGYASIMPTFKGQVSEEEIIKLIAFIQSLQRGQTPRRVEDFPPPSATPPINAEDEKR